MKKLSWPNFLLWTFLFCTFFSQFNLCIYYFPHFTLFYWLDCCEDGIAWSCLVWTQVWPNGFIQLQRETVATVGQTTLVAIIRKQQVSAKSNCTSLINSHIPLVFPRAVWCAPGAITPSLLAGKSSLTSNIQTPPIIQENSLWNIYFYLIFFSFRFFLWC